MTDASGQNGRPGLFVQVNEAFRQDDLDGAIQTLESVFAVQKQEVAEFTAVPIAHAHVDIDPVAVKAVLYSLEANVIYGTLLAGLSRLFRRQRQTSTVSKLEISSGETHGILETSDPQALGEMIKTIPALLQKPPGYYELNASSTRWRKRPMLGDETLPKQSKRPKGKKGKKGKK